MKIKMPKFWRIAKIGNNIHGIFAYIGPDNIKTLIFYVKPWPGYFKTNAYKEGESGLLKWITEDESKQVEFDDIDEVIQICKQEKWTLYIGHGYNKKGKLEVEVLKP